MIVIIEAFLRVTLFFLQTIYHTQRNRILTSFIYNKQTYKNGLLSKFKRNYARLFSKNEVEWMKTQLDNIQKQPYHVILIMNENVQLQQLIQVIQYISFTQTKYVTIYDIKGKLADYIPKLHSDMLSKQFNNSYNARSIQLFSSMSDKKQVQYEIKNTGKSLHIQFLDYQSNHKDYVNKLKRSISKNEDLVIERDLLCYKIFNINEPKDSSNVKQFSTALLMQFDDGVNGCHGLPFPFLKSSEMLFNQNIQDFSYHQFINLFQLFLQKISCYLAYNKTQQREGK